MLKPGESGEIKFGPEREPQAELRHYLRDPTANPRTAGVMGREARWAFCYKVFADGHCGKAGGPPGGRSQWVRHPRKSPIWAREVGLVRQNLPAGASHGISFLLRDSLMILFVSRRSMTQKSLLPSLSITPSSGQASMCFLSYLLLQGHACTQPRLFHSPLDF